MLPKNSEWLKNRKSKKWKFRKETFVVKSLATGKSGLCWVTTAPSLPVGTPRCFAPQKNPSRVNTSLFLYSQPKFPYELSRPIPRETVSSASSVMNTQVICIHWQIIAFFKANLTYLDHATLITYVAFQVTDDMKELFHHKPERFQRRDLMRVKWHRTKPDKSDTYTCIP